MAFSALETINASHQEVHKGVYSWRKVCRKFWPFYNNWVELFSSRSWLACDIANLSFISLGRSSLNACEELFVVSLRWKKYSLHSALIGSICSFNIYPVMSAILLYVGMTRGTSIFFGSKIGCMFGCIGLEGDKEDNNWPFQFAY